MWICITRTCCCLGPDFYLYLMGVSVTPHNTTGRIASNKSLQFWLGTAFFYESHHVVVEKVSSTEVGGMMFVHPVRESSRLEIIGCVAVDLTSEH